MVGGLGIGLFFLIKILTDQQPSTNAGWFVFYLSFAVNFPHFLASYQLLYGDFRSSWAKNYRYLAASVIVPITLAAIIGYALYQSSAVLLELLVQSMFFFVGWHYVKQSFGIFIACSSYDGIRFNSLERQSVKFFLFSLWGLSWIGSNRYNNTNQFEGVAYQALQIPETFLHVNYGVTFILASICLYLAYKKYIREGQICSLSSATAVIIMAIWYVPGLYNPTYFMLIPFFHSLQYLYFVFLFKTQEGRSMYPEANSEHRAGFLMHTVGFYVLATLLGALSMYWIPYLLDQNPALKTGLPNMQSYMFAALIFINIHHYFIDHAIWRHDNETMKKFVFGKA